MWKKDEPTPSAPQPAERAPLRSRENDPSPSAAPSAHASPTVHATPPARGARSDQAAIGPSITIRGEVSGDEDLLIQGTVEGSVDLGHHAVEVGREGRVKANISGRIVTVEGSVEGDLRAEEQIVLRPSAEVKGDITAPRVVLEDGARFRGMVEMGESVAPKTAAKGASSEREAAAAGSGRSAPSSSSGGRSDASGKDKDKDKEKEKDKEPVGAKTGSDKSAAAGDKSRTEREKVAEAR